MLDVMKPGSVVDLAAEAGGNCEATVKGELAVYNDVKFIEYTDLPSRLPTQSSTLYNNITKFLLSMAPKEKEFGLDLSDEVVRGAIVTLDGEILPPAPRPAPPPTPAKPAPVALTTWQRKTREVAAVTTAMGGVMALGKFTGPLFMSNAFTFALTSLVGYCVVWGVVPALHSPLMSVTNAISGMVGVGGLFVLSGGYLPETVPQLLGALSVLLAFVNVGGGFVITKRMLDMFKRPTDPPSIRGCTASPPSSLAAAMKPPPRRARPVWCRLAISRARSSASGPSRASRRRQRPGWATCWASLAWDPASWRARQDTGFSPEVLAQFGGLAAMGTLAGMPLSARHGATRCSQARVSSSSSASRLPISRRPSPRCTRSSVWRRS